MPSLTVVDSPAMRSIRESFVHIGHAGSTNSNLDQLTLVDEDLKIVAAAFREDLCSQGGLEAVALGRFGLEAFRVQLYLGTGLGRVPVE